MRRRKRRDMTLEEVLWSDDWRASLEHLAMVWDERYTMQLERIARLEAEVKALKEFFSGPVHNG